MPATTSGQSSARPATHEMRSAITADSSVMKATVIGRRSHTSVGVDGDR